MRETKQQRQERVLAELATEQSRLARDRAERRRQDILADPYAHLIDAFDREIRLCESALWEALPLLSEQKRNEILSSPLNAQRLQTDANQAASRGWRLSELRRAREWTADARAEWLAARQVVESGEE